MARKYTVTSGKTAAPAAGVVKVCVQLATPATATNTLIGADITFDSTATGAGSVPVLVEIVRYTGASSGGAVATPAAWKKSQVAALTTARINDTTDGAGPTVIMGWLISPLQGVLQQLPLGREIEMEVSDFVGIRVTPQTGFTACNYDVNAHIEE